MGGEKKLIKTIEATRWHTTLVYWIPPSGRNNIRLCDQCDNQAEFLYYDEDHWRQYFLKLFCNEHCWTEIKQWLAEER
ncbi:MAG: hypothetical protein UW61_C0028G0003 [Candidatus Curtissbacteria bacterium GW2011_GWC1_44_33]|nr:MAG: hypothetical protein UW61_C0028G0003 [Candidatus Curtissbacteria bacterium GW2011_GWC1_44_33]